MFERNLVTRTRVILASALVAAAGGLASAQSDRPRESQPDAHSQPESAKGTSRALAYFSKCKGSAIKNAEGKSVAEINNVIFDRHSGDIAAYVVYVGGYWVVSPSDVRATVASDGAVTFHTTLTADQVKNSQKFESKAFDIKAGSEPSVTAWWSRFDQDWEQWNAGSSNPRTNRDWSERTKSSETTKLEGEIVSLYRVEGEQGAYRTIAIVKPKSGDTRTVLLGPTWYLSDERVLPVRGQRVAMTVVPIDNVEGAEWAATQLSTNGGTPHELRTGTGYTPAWSGKRAQETSRRRLVTASDIIGDDVKCHDELSGEVDNLVIDHKTNRVLAYVIDPNENFMGLGDTRRLIPLSIADASRDDLIFVDAGKPMIVNSPAAPDSLNALNNAWNIDKVFDQRPIASRP